jgi:DNA modification methylase
VRTVEADAVEYLGELESESFDIVFTSPPFKSGDVDGDYWRFYDEVHQEILRVAGKAVFVIQSATNLNRMVSEYDPDRTLVWGKKVSQYSYRYNPIFCFQVDQDYSVEKRIWTDALGIPSVPPSQKKHKYQDPVTLYRTVLGMVDDCSSVLDPFVGSGTTLVAALQVGMDAVGVDKESACIQTAEQRLQQQTLHEIREPSGDQI